MQRYGFMLAVGVLAPPWMAFGCNGALTPQAKAILDAGSAAYGRGDYESTLRHMDRFLREHSGLRGADQALYIRGKAKLELNDLAGAKADLQEALDRTRLPQVQVNASNALGDLAWNEGDMATAETMYRRAIQSARKDEPGAAHARYRLGCVLQRRGSWRDADLQFDRLMYLFGDTELGRRAKLRVRCRAWTVQVGSFTDSALADEMAARLQAADLPAAVEAVGGNGRPLFRVQVGRFATYEQATAMLEKPKVHAKDAYVNVTR